MMFTQFFFDDQRLFGRENLRRVYGTPELLAEYFDGEFSTDYHTGYAFRLADGRVRLLYYGKSIKTKRGAFLSAISGDGVHFVPEDLSATVDLPNRQAAHEVFPGGGGEVAAVYEDANAEPRERYKLLFTECRNMRVDGTLWASPDLLHWSQVETKDEWNDGCEPVTGIFRNPLCPDTTTILRRPAWGDRRVGYSDTKDFRTFTEYAPCMRADALDAPLDELYGCPSFAYGGLAVGFPHIYAQNLSCHNTKYTGGCIYPQFAYSFDGHYWIRSLREPFFKDVPLTGTMTWLGSVLTRENDILLYTAHTPNEHGNAFAHPAQGRIRIYRLRRDGFVGLRADSGTGTVITREFAHNGGEISLNLTAKRATCAVYLSDLLENSDANVLGKSFPLAGYTHEDCVPFTGDCNSWTPVFRGGTLDALRGKTLIFDIRIEDGTLYSLTADALPLMNTEAARYRVGKSVRGNTVGK